MGWLMIAMVLGSLTSAQLLGGLLGSLTVALGMTINSALTVATLGLTGGVLNCLAPLSVNSFDWSGGSVAMSGSGAFNLNGYGNVWPCSTCGSTPLTMSGGSATCGSFGAWYLNSGSNVAKQSCAINNGKYQLSGNSQLSLRSCNIASSSSFSGSSSSQTNIENGPTVCNARCHFDAPCNIKPGGELRATDSGYISVDDSQELCVRGGTIGCSGACGGGSSSNVVVGNDFGYGGKLAFRGAQPSVCKAGVVELKGQSEIEVEAGHEKQVQAPCVVTGAGKAQVHGRLHAQAKYTCDHVQTHLHQGGSFKCSGSGQLVVNGGHTFTCHQGSAHFHENVQLPVTHSIGCDTCNKPATLECVCDTPGSCAPTEFNAGAKVDIKAQAKVQVKSYARAKHNGPCEYKGAGQVHVEANGCHEAAHVVTHSNSFTHIKEQAKLTISGASGQYVCAPGHTLNLKGGAVEHVNAQQQDTIVVGCDTCGQPAAIECQPASQPAELRAGARINVKAQAKLHVQSNSQLHIKGDSRIKGSGMFHVEGSCEAQDKLHINGPCEVPHTGELACTGTQGQVKIYGGNEVHIKGGKCRGDLASAQASGGSNFCVGEAAGSAAAALRFKATTNTQAPAAPCEIKGGRYEVKATGKIYVDNGAEAKITQPCHFAKAINTAEGKGRVQVDGHLNCDEAHTADIDHDINGQHTLNCAKSHAYSNINYASTAVCNMKAGASGYTAVKVQGQANLKGRLNIQNGGYTPTAPCKLMECTGGCVGKFDSVSSNSQVKGSIQTTSSAVIWHPNSSTCTGTCTPVL